MQIFSENVKVLQVNGNFRERMQYFSKRMQMFIELMQHFLNECKVFLWGTQYFCERMQMFCGWRLSFLGQHNIFAKECKVFLGGHNSFANDFSDCKVSRENANVLWVTTEFLKVTQYFYQWTQKFVSDCKVSRGKRNSFARKHKCFPSERRATRGIGTFLQEKGKAFVIPSNFFPSPCPLKPSSHLCCSDYMTWLSVFKSLWCSHYVTLCKWSTTRG